MLLDAGCSKSLLFSVLNFMNKDNQFINNKKGAA